MSSSEAIDYLYRLARHSGMVDEGELKDWAGDCLRLGLRDFWGASEWSFRTYEYNLVISSELDDHELPNDFSGVVTVKEKDSLEGQELTYYPKAEFDKIVPKPLAYSSTYPQIYTLWHDKSNQKWYARFFPTPESGHTIVMEIVSKPPQEMSAIGEEFVGGILAMAQKYMYPLNNVARLQAWEEARREIKRLEVVDSPFQGKNFRMFDDTDTEVMVSRPWL